MRYLLFCMFFVTSCTINDHQRVFDEVSKGCIKACKNYNWLETRNVRINPESIECYCK